MAKTPNLYVRIEPEVKEEAEAILSALGIPVSNAINMFYKQIILQKGIPFDVKIPVHPLDINNMSKKELYAQIQLGLDDIENGQVERADKVFSEIHKEIMHEIQSRDIYDERKIY